MRAALNSTPAYKDNRERVAVVIRQGLAAYDAYAKAQPWIFGGSLVGAAVCTAGLWKRTGAEARTLYGSGLAACLVIAWFTRPGQLPAAPPGTKPEEAASAGVVAYIDRKRADYRREDPAWADRTMARVADLPGVREQVAAAPILRAVLG